MFAIQRESLLYIFISKSQTINHFARKFEPIVNNEIINQLDEWMFGAKLLLARNSYWENFYHSSHDKGSKYDITLTFLQSFVRIAAKSLRNSQCEYYPIWRAKEATIHMFNDTFDGVLSLQDMKIVWVGGAEKNTLEVESYFKPRVFSSIQNGNMSEPANRLKSLTVSNTQPSGHTTSKRRCYDIFLTF